MKPSLPPLARMRRRTLLSFPALSFVAASLGALGTGCASRPDVRTDRDPQADLSAYRTFTIDSTPTPRAPALRLGVTEGGYTTLQQARLEQATRRELERRGLTAVAERADLRVYPLLKIESGKELHGTPGARFGAGTRGFGAWGGSTLETVDVRRGTLVIDLVDARRNALVWRGVTEGHLDDEAVKDPGPAIERAVAEVFTHFTR